MLWAVYAFTLVLLVGWFLVSQLHQAGAQEGTPLPPCPGPEAVGTGTPWPGPADVSWEYLQDCAHCLAVTPVPTSPLSTYVPTAVPPAEHFDIDCPASYSIHWEDPGGVQTLPLIYHDTHPLVYGAVFTVHKPDAGTPFIWQTSHVEGYVPSDVTPLWLVSSPSDNVNFEDEQTYCYIVQGHEDLCEQYAPDAEVRYLDDDGSYIPAPSSNAPLVLTMSVAGTSEDFWLSDLQLIYYADYSYPCGGVPPTPTPTPVASPSPTSMLASTCGVYDWCYLFDFRDATHSFSIHEGIWTAGVGFEGTNNWWNGSRLNRVTRRSVAGRVFEVAHAEAWYTLYNVPTGDVGGYFQWELNGWNCVFAGTSALQSGDGHVSWNGSCSQTVGWEFALAFHYDDQDTRVDGVRQRTKLHQLYVAGYGQAPFNDAFSSVAPPTPTPTPTLTPTPWSSPTPFATLDSERCRVIDWREESSPVTEFDFDIETLLADSDCFNVVPEMTVTTPDLGAIGDLIGLDTYTIEWDGVMLCVIWVNMPTLSVVGLHLSLDWFLLPAVAWLINRLLSL